LMAGWKSEGRAQHLLNPERHPVVMLGLHEDVVGAARKAVWLLMAAVGFVLLIACVNVANLLLARAESRHREFAVRLALGAGLRRMVRQFVAEGFVLVFIASILGVVLAFVGLKILLLFAPDSVPRTEEMALVCPYSRLPSRLRSSRSFCLVSRHSRKSVNVTWLTGFAAPGSVQFEEEVRRFARASSSQRLPSR
jgi:ABC-type antimicrobial peptide transport system permease subunit